MMVVMVVMTLRLPRAGGPWVVTSRRKAGNCRRKILLPTLPFFSISE